MTLIPPTSTKRKTETISLWLTGALVVLSAAGCSRSHYRRQADVDAYGLVGQLSTDPRWQLPGYTINVDPASRMYDPYDPDRPPMPPDDPTSHQLMHCVDCRRGYPHWHADGDTPHIENPYWLSCLPVNDENKLIVNADTAVRLALLHSPDYQEELEELYLSALDVSFERFVFDHQFFAGQSLTFTADGRDRSTSGGQSQSVLDLSTSPGGRWSMTKLYTTGAELVVGLANSLVWQFAGPDTYTANTLLDFSLVQPLLRGAGRDRVLERLTIAERALLANVRQMERFRRGFYVEIVTGDDAGQGPSRRGGFFGGSGLEGFTGVGGGGFGRVGGFSFGGFGAGGFGAGAGAEMAGGFLGLLQEQQGLRNQDATIASLRNSLAQLEAYYNAGRIDFLQVQQARQALFNAESQRLNATAGFQSQLDNFKRDLGLPPQLEMTIDESLLKPFDLIDSNLVPIQDQLTELQKSIGDVILDLIPAEDNVDARPLTWSPRLVQVLLALQDYLRQVSGIRQSLAEASVPQARQDIIRLREAIPRRRQQLQTMEQDSRGQQTRRPSDWRGVIQTAKNTGQHENISVCSANVDVSRAQGDRTSNQLSQRKPPVPTRTDYITPLPLVDAEHRMRSLAEKQKRVVTLCRHVRRGMRVVPVSNQVATSSGGAIMDAIDIDQLQQLPELLEAMLTELMTRLDETGAHLQTYEQAIVRLLEDGPRLEQNVLSQRLREEVVAPIPNEVTELSAQVLELLLVQARARTESVTLVPITLDPDEAIEIAKVNRRDWMNARANLVDAWRLIQFNANDLESDLDITFSGDISNLNDDPFGFRGSTGRLRVGVEFDAPITRLGERNNYRQALIEFQQARRSYYEFGDRIAQGLRETIRTINVNLLNFELRRAAVQVAIAQVELARLRLQEPPKPEVVAEFGATTARDLVSALSDLLDAQNFFLSVWVNYEVLRRVLDFDLGTMQLDLDGLWLDPGPIGVLAPSVEKLDAPEPQEDLEADFALDRRVARVFKDLPDSNRDWFPGKALSAELPLGVVEIHSRQNRSQVARNVSVDRESATPDSRLSRLPPVD